MIARVVPPTAPLHEVAAPIAGGAIALREGTVLGAWQVVEPIGQGGFGIVYRARRTDGDGDVAIKEYLPAQLAVRDAHGALAPASPAVADTYAAGLRGFLDEARLLAGLRHPGLVEVIDAWEQRGTAYMAMPLYDGPTLERVIAAHPAGLDEAALRAIVAPLLGALATIHAAGCVHRDVAPDNVVVRPDGGAVLLDLGAARRVIGDRVRATTVMLKAGYAPIEQYADDPDCRIGPWSDVYALAAVMHHALVGEAPPPSPLRVMRDTRVPLATRRPPGCSSAFVDAIDAAMALRPEDRPRSAREFAVRLGLPDAVPAGTGDAPAAPAPGATPARRRGRSIGLALSAAAVFVASVAAWLSAVPQGVPAEPPVEAAALWGESIRALASARDAAERAAGRGEGAREAAREGTREGARVAAREGTPEAGRGDRAARGTVSPSAAASSRPGAPAPAPPVATLRLAVTPWAEVWVDGVKRGVTPPLKTLALAPGERRVELRNPASAPVVRRVDAKPGESVDLAHRFGAREGGR